MDKNFDYNENFDAFLRMINEQQNRIKNALNSTMVSLSLNASKFFEIKAPKVEPLGKKLKSSFGNINTERILETQNTFNSIADELNNIQNIFTKEFRDFLNNAGIKIRESLLLELSLLGELEWCYWGIEELDDSKLWKMSPTYLREYLVVNEETSIKNIDTYIAKYFTKKIIDNIANRTIFDLDENDIKKFNQAMVDFRARRYLDCANLLASLIDSQSIKQELDDLGKGRYGEYPDNITQGWQAFYIVFRNDLSKYFDGNVFVGKGKKEAREKGFKEFMEKVKDDLSDYETKIPILLLAACLIKFFEDSNWRNYPKKPGVINRHWLMHGMYDIDDITKSDCIKLLLMLNQLADIYAKVKKGEL